MDNTTKTITTIVLRSIVSSKKRTLSGRIKSSAPDFQPINSSVTLA
ncbi:19492_t:CDS:1, partial [Funneliformis geosporum]